MLLLTDENGRAIQCDSYGEAKSLTPDHLITITDDDDTRWYVIGPAEQHENHWTVPLQVVSEADEPEARRTGTIKTLYVTGDAGLAEN